jgi:hypothetical protein
MQGVSFKRCYLCSYITFGKNKTFYAKHLGIVYNQLPQDLQDKLWKESEDKGLSKEQPQQTKQIPSSRPKVRKTDLKDEDTLVDTPQQPSQQQPPPQQQQQLSSSSRQQQQQ